MAQDINRRIQIFIDGTAATQSIDKVRASIVKLEADLNKLNPAEEEFASKSKKLKDQLEAKNRTLENYKTKVAETQRVLKNLSGATYNELIAAQSHVRKGLREAVPGTNQHTAALEQNRRVTEALTRSQNAMRVEVGCQGTAWGRAANFVNKYMALIGGIVASLTGLSMTIRRSVDDFAKISEAMAGVKKYTGMTDEQVKDLNESFKQMDTRTARERLNELAQDAGRLGLKGKKDILEFVDAANIINVALGKDLGEDAVKNIGKLAQMFGDDKTMGLRGAMLATGSAINEIAQNSSAAESYLVDFTARVAGTGKQAGIAQTQIMGFASVLDQDMQQVEMSATALQNVIMKIYQEPAKFAKMAGMDVKEFTGMMKTDANEAVLRFLENIGKIGGLSDTAPLFKEMKLDGVRAAGVINTLAANVDRVRQEQERANQAYKDGSSVVNEYNIQNNTVQAGLEKAKKRFQEVSYELGEKMVPYMSRMITSTGTLVRGLGQLVTFTVKYSGAIASAAVIIGVYLIATKAATIAETKLKDTKLTSLIVDKATVLYNKIKLASLLLLSVAHYALAGNTVMASAAMAKFNLVTKLNPIGLLLSVMAAAGMAIYHFTSRVSEGTKAVRTFMEENEKERRALQNLVDATQAAGDKTQRRKELIDEINSKYGQYLPKLLDEHSTLRDIEQAYKDINIAMEQNIAKKVLSERTDSIRNEGLSSQIEKMNDLKEALEGTLPESQINDFARKLTLFTDKSLEAGNTVDNTTKAARGALAKYYKDSEDMPAATWRKLKAYIKESEDIAKKVKDVNKELNPFIDEPTKKVTKGKPANELDEVVISANRKAGGSYTPDDDDEKIANKSLKKKLDAEKSNYEANQSLLKELYLEGHDETLQTEKQFKNTLEQLELEHYQRIIAIAGSKSKDGISAQNSINDMLIEQKKVNIQKQIDSENELYEKQQNDLKNLYVSGQDENLKTEEAYNDAMEQLTIKHLERTLEIAGLDAEQRKDIEQKVLDFKIKCLQDEEKERKKRQDTEQKRKDDLAKKEKQRLEKQADQYRQYGEQIGESVGNMISGQEDAMRGFADTMIDILFDVLSQLIEIEIAKATGVAVGAVARSSAESLAQADSVATFGATGVARAAILSGLIMGALAAAKATLKGLVRGGGKSSSTGEATTTEQPKRASVQVSQWASGRYDVIGESDGRTYKDVPFIGHAPTGIVRRTSLVSETGAELIINAEDLMRLQRHINYPVVLQAIQDARSGHVPQRVEGNYEALENSLKKFTIPTTQQSQSANSEEVNQLIAAIKQLIPALKSLRAYVLLRDIQEAEATDEKSKKPFTRPKK